MSDQAIPHSRLIEALHKFINRKKLEAAEELAYFLIGSNNLDGEAFGLAGKVYRAKGNFKLAARMFNQALVIDPDSNWIGEALRETIEAEELEAAKSTAVSEKSKLPSLSAPEPYVCPIRQSP